MNRNDKSSISLCWEKEIMNWIFFSWCEIKICNSRINNFEKQIKDPTPFQVPTQCLPLPFMEMQIIASSDIKSY